MDIALTNLEKLIEECWNKAESASIQAVAKKHLAPQEDEITFLFSGELRLAVEEASDTRRVEKAFLTDLRQSIPTLDFDILRMCSGLLARVNRHSRQHEGKVSGADLGIVIIKPLVRLAFDANHIEVLRDRARGLLVQAKLGRQANHLSHTHKWNGLTPSQKRLYPRRRDYYSLLLYRLGGRNLNDLKAFGWQLCKEHPLKAVQEWLRSDAFPEEISSSQLFRKLFAASIGTGDPETIKSAIDPPKSKERSITIHIFWPDGKGPPRSLPLGQQQWESQRVQQRIQQ